MMYPIEVTSQQIASIRLQFHTNLDIFFFLSNEKQRKKKKGEREKCKSTIFSQQILNSRLLFTVISEKKII